MLNEKMVALGTQRSVIRELFEFGKQRAAIVGAENVFDFSLGNPSVPAPKEVTEIMKEFLETVPAEVLHGYTSGPGDFGVRTEIANYIKNKFGVDATPNLIYMTCGAAASLTISLNALVNSGDEVIVLAPFFPEYRVFAEQAGATLKVVPCKTEDLQIVYDVVQHTIKTIYPQYYPMEVVDFFF